MIEKVQDMLVDPNQEFAVYHKTREGTMSSIPYSIGKYYACIDEAIKLNGALKQTTRIDGVWLVCSYPQKQIIDIYEDMA